MRKEINVGLIGLGTVGMGVARLLKKNASVIKQKSGTTVKLKRACDLMPGRARDLKKLGYDNKVFTTKAADILKDDDIDIVVELIGGYEPAKEFMLSAIRSRKHVVTANKALLAKHWASIFSAADRNRVLVCIEASVGSGIPIIHAINEGLSANRITSLMGILNGTTNYVLTKMTADNMDFKAALAEAKKHGFAEADPTADINGRDAANKLVVLASIIFGAHVKPSAVYCEGIEGIKPEDIKFAREEFGYIVKLLAIMKNENGYIDVRVHPTLIPESHLLSSVSNEYNAIYVSGDAVSDTMYYGKGAGEQPTASAVVSDIIYLSKNIHNDIAGKAPYFICDPKKKMKVRSIDDIVSRYYVRINSVDRPGVLSKISGVLGKHGVSIASVYQMERGIPGGNVPIVMVTHRAREGSIRKAIGEINRLSIASSKSVIIRIADLDKR